MTTRPEAEKGSGDVAAEVAGDLSEPNHDPAVRRRGRARGVAVTVLLLVGTLLAVGAGVGIWAQRQALNTDEWVMTSSRLLENEQIRTAVGLYLVDQLYEREQVEARLAERLPPRLQPLAARAAAGLENTARQNAGRLLGSAVALQAWREANRSSHATLLMAIDGADIPVDLDLGDLLERIAADTGLPAAAVDRLPPDVAELQIVPPEKVEQVRTAIDAFRALGFVLLGLAVVAFAAATLLSADRRRTVLSAGLCFVAAGVALLAVRRLAGGWVVDQLADAPNAHAVADEVWAIATSLMVDVAQGGILLGLLVATGAWLVGPGRRAVTLRRAAAPAFREHPAAARAALAVVLMLLIAWGPVPWTQQAIPLVLLAIAAFIWLELVMRRACAEGPVAPAPTSATDLVQTPS